MEHPKVSGPDPSAASRRPRVSVGMPVYNGERYLAEALKAISDQTFVDYEVLISDNASTDRTREICERFVALDNRFRYFRQPANRGGSWNFNEVVRRANGEYFKWAAHDDIMEPTCLEVCVNTLDVAPPEVAMCYPWTTVIDADGATISRYADNLDIRERTPAARFRTLLRNYDFSSAIFGLFRTESLRRTRLVGSYNSADFVLLAEIVLVGQVWEVPDREFKRRWHDGMSMEANPTNKEIALWYDPKNTGLIFMPRTRLFGENIRAIFSIRMPVRQRLLSVWVLVAEWTPRYWRVIGGEFRRGLMGILCRRSPPDR